MVLVFIHTCRRFIKYCHINLSIHLLIVIGVSKLLIYGDISFYMKRVNVIIDRLF